MTILLMCLVPGIPTAAHDPDTVAMHECAMQWRRHYGLAVQSLDEDCCRMAQRHATRMARFEHYDHGPDDQVITIGYRTPRSAVRSWVYSPPHLAWLLSGTKKAGWGHAVSPTGQHYWCGVFR